MAAYLFWQLALLCAAARVATRLAQKRSPETCLPLLLSAAIVLEALPATLLSFAHANTVGAYLAVAVLFLAFGARPAVFAELWTNLRQLSIWRFRFTAAILCAAVIPLFFLAFKPIEEIDSANYLHYLLEWRAGRLTPYTFSTNYVAFGPSRFLPALVLAKTDWFFGPVAFEPVLLLFFALCLLGEEMGVPPRLRIWTAASAVALQHLWGTHSGVGTLKSDPLHAAGVVLLALVLVRAVRRAAPFDPAMFAFAVAFATEKYTGVLLGGAVLGALLLLRVRLISLVPAGLLFLVTTGHYYLRSLLLWGNPFYPFTVRLGPFALPGTGDLSGTSIAANWHNPHLWELFFLPAHGSSPAGLLFPLALAAILLAALWTIASGARRRPPEFWLAALLLLGWLLFTRTFWGAGAGPNSLGYLENDLSTLRYVIAFVALGELFVVWFLWKRGVPETVLLALVALNLASRWWLLHPPPEVLLAVAALTAGLLCLRFQAAGAAVVAVAVLCCTPLIVEHNRQSWFLVWKGIYQPLRHLSPATIFLLDDPNAGFSAAQFPLSGAHLQHDVRTGPAAAEVRDARYAIRVLTDLQRQDDLRSFAAELLSRGYRTVLEDPHGIILERLRPTAWDPSATEAWYLGPDELPAAGRYRPGDLVLSPAKLLLRIDPVMTQAPQPPPGATLRLRNGGTIRFQDHGWQSERPALPLSPSPAISISRGQYQVERLQDRDGPYLRIRAQNDAQWLVLVSELPSMPDRQPFTALSVARCPAGLACTFWLWTRSEVSDYAGPANGEWHTFRLLRRAQNPASGDHLAVGIKDPRAGAFFDVHELGALQGFYP